jgi:DNA-binding protein Fis
MLLPGSLPSLLGATSGPVTSALSTTDDPGLEAFIGQCLASTKSDLHAEARRQMDRILLARSLEKTGGNQLRAARWLGIGRETLRRRLREVGIHLNHRVDADAEDEPLVDSEAVATAVASKPLTSPRPLREIRRRDRLVLRSLPLVSPGKAVPEGTVGPLALGTTPTARTWHEKCSVSRSYHDPHRGCRTATLTARRAAIR